MISSRQLQGPAPLAHAGQGTRRDNSDGRASAADHHEERAPGRAEDQALVERLVVGDESALRQIMDDHGPSVLGMARRVAVDPAMAEEVAQDVFLTLWRRPEAFDRGRGGLKTFLVAMARHKAIDAVRKQETYERALRKVDPDPEVISPTDRIDDSHGLQLALRRLTRLQREALVLAYYGGLTYREVAGHLGVPEGTAKTRLHDGLSNLRRILASSPTA
ncbi:MAG: sigma-70 family RNA polymerase sigma factor [Actinomycetota bacterium]|nr:sigma-70 family RNA polymerase sigma factor [Actinomycetota bacterium]